MTTQYPLTLDEFKFWLETKSEDRIVGATQFCTICPIATALKEQIKLTEVLVYQRVSRINHITYKNPYWVEQFITEIDKSSEGDITTKKALEVLNNFLICTKCNKRNEKGTNCGREDCDF